MTEPPTSAIQRRRRREPKRLPWQSRGAVGIQSLTATILVATGIALLAMQGSVRDVADEQRLLRTDDLGYPQLPEMDEVMISRFTIPAIVYLALAVVYAGLALANYRRLAGARALSWWIGSIAALFGCWWGLGRIWQPTHVMDEVFHVLMGYVDEAMPTWLAVIEFWPLFVLLAGLIPVGRLLNASVRTNDVQSRPGES